MTTLYYVYNQFYHNKGMMYDEGTGLVKLITPSGDAAQKWAIETDGNAGGQIAYKIRNIKENRYLAAELNGPQVTVTTNQETANNTKKWMLPDRPPGANEFTTNIKSPVNGNLLASNGHFIVTDNNGQRWKFVIEN